MIGKAAISKTMRDKEDSEGCAEHVDHSDHKIKLNTACHPYSSQQPLALKNLFKIQN